LLQSIKTTDSTQELTKQMKGKCYRLPKLLKKKSKILQDITDLKMAWQKELLETEEWLAGEEKIFTSALNQLEASLQTVLADEQKIRQEVGITAQALLAPSPKDPAENIAIAAAASGDTQNVFQKIQSRLKQAAEANQLVEILDTQEQEEVMSVSSPSEGEEDQKTTQQYGSPSPPLSIGTTKEKILRPVSRVKDAAARFDKRANRAASASVTRTEKEDEDEKQVFQEAGSQQHQQ
jgi:hypothetical protein